MKIIIVSRYHIFDIPGGGGEVTMHEYALNLAKMGNEVTMLVTNNKDIPALEKVTNGYNIIRYRSFKNSLFTALPKMIKDIKNIQPDIVIMTSFADATVGYFIQKWAKVKVIALTHDEFNIYGFRPPFNVFFWINRKFFAKRIHKIVAVNHNAARAIQRELDFYPQVTYTGFGEDRNFEEIPKKYKFCFIGRFFKEKGMNYLADAVIDLAKYYSDVNCVFIGSGGYLDEFKNKYKEQIDSGVFIIKGYLSNEELDYTLSSSKFFVNPTYANEGIVFTNIQAMKAGVVVVTTNIGAITEVVKDEYNGIVCSPKNEKSLMLAMKEALLMSDKRYKEFQEAGFETGKFFTGAKATDRLWMVLNE